MSPRRGGPARSARRRATPPIVGLLIDRLAPLGAVTARAMFGGHGLYLDGLMFGLVWADAAYLKVDDLTRGDYERAGMPPFRPYADRAIAFSYFELPPAALREPEALREFASRAHGAARRAQAKKAERSESRRIRF